MYTYQQIKDALNEGRYSGQYDPEMLSVLKKLFGSPAISDQEFITRLNTPAGQYGSGREYILYTILEPSPGAEVRRNVDQYINWNGVDSSQTQANAAREKALTALTEKAKQLEGLGVDISTIPVYAEFYSQLGATPGSGQTSAQTAKELGQTGAVLGEQKEISDIQGAAGQAQSSVGTYKTNSDNLSVPAQQYQILDLASMAKYRPDQYTRQANGAVILNPGVAPIEGTVKTISGVSTVQPSNLTVKYQILDVASMSKYSPNQYSRQADGSVILNSGVAPIAGTVKEISSVNQLPVSVSSAAPINTQDTSSKSIYRIGTDIYDAETGLKIPNVETLKRDYAGAKEVDAPAGSNSSSDATSSTDTNKDSDKIIYKQGNDLYIKNGNSYYKIPDQKTLEDLVFNKGYKDTRPEVPQGSIIGSIGESNADGNPVNTTKLSEALNEKLYNATGRIIPTDEDIANYMHNPKLFERQLDDIIAQKAGDAKSKADAEAVQKVKDNVQSGSQALNLNAPGLFKFIEDPDGAGPQNTATVYYMDPITKTLRPFLSEEAFNNAFEGGFNLADADINLISTAQLGEGQAFANFKVLANDYGFKNDGTYTKEEPPVDKTKISATYGKARDIQAEREAIKAVDNLLEKVKKDSDIQGISTSVLDSIVNDEAMVGFYANALAYGDYSITDILRDMRRKQLVKNGDTSMSGMNIIDSTTTADKYYATPEGAAIKANNSIVLADTLDGIKITDLDKPIYKLASDLYDTFVPTLDLTSKDTQTAIEQVKAAYYDVIAQQLSAVNEHDKAIADENYKLLQQKAERELGYKLSDNSREAWTQLNSLDQNASARGLTNTGIAEEAKNKYLTDVRRSDERARQLTMTTEEENKRLYYLNSASADEIAALTEEEKQKYGLIPSEEAKQWFSIDNLRTLYPDLTEQQLKNYADSVIDPKTGTYRSVLYQNLAANQLKNAEEKRVYQTGELKYDANGNVIGGSGYLYEQYLKDQAAYRPYEKGGLVKEPVAPETTPTNVAVQLDSNGLLKTPLGNTDSGNGTTVGVGLYKPGVGTVGIDDPITGGINTNPNNGTTPKKATLYGPNGQKEVVDVGSARASELQSLGWGLTEGSYKAPNSGAQKATLYGPNGAKEVVDVGSARASELQSQGWGLTEGSYKASSPSIQKATLYGPNGTKEVVDVGSNRASQLQSQGWGLTEGSYKSSGVTAPSTTPKATLYGPSGAKEVVDVGSQRASDLQSQGWGLTEGSYNQTNPAQTNTTIKKATLWGPNGQKEVVDVGSARASELQSQGWGLTEGSYKALSVNPVNTPTTGIGLYQPGVGTTTPAASTPTTGVGIYKPSANLTNPTPTIGVGLYKPSTTIPDRNAIPTVPSTPTTGVGLYKPTTPTTTPSFGSTITSQAGLDWLKKTGLK